MEVKLTNSAKKFLVFSYFGITEDELEENNESVRKSIAMKCAERAYLDMCRTLTFSEKMDGRTKEEKDEIKEKRKKFRDDICDLIVKNLIKSPGDKGLFEGSPKGFCGRHYDLCVEIKDTANNYEGNSGLLLKRNEENKEPFSHGQAQKWLNMTIKYMLMFQCFDYLIDEDYKGKLHVPVDSYVIKAAKELQKDEELAAKIKISPKAWSKWNEGEYKEFQDSLRTALGTRSPIEWEERVWIERAKELRENN